jgi:5-methylcytosine-specific restriction endonuclease McrA
MATISKPVLVLNATYEPINICSWQRAIKLVVKGAAEVEQTHEKFIHVGLHLPSVIRLKHYRRVPHRIQDLTRRNIFIRDGYRCQYCWVHVPHGKGLELEHVVPRSQGGRSSWSNLVAACSKCNKQKANRTPEEAGMPLRVRPRELTVHTARGLIRNAGVGEEKWQKYLWYQNESA